MTSTGERFRKSVSRRIRRKNQDGLSQLQSILGDAKISEDEKNVKGESPSQSAVPQISPYSRSHTNFDKDPSTEFAESQSEIGSRKRSINNLDENIETSNVQPTVSFSLHNKGSKIILPTTETEIRKTICEFNAVFQQYSELFLKPVKQDLKRKSQSSAKFELPDTTETNVANVGTMTDLEGFQIFRSKSSRKIKKCRYNKTKKKFKKKSSFQNFRSVRSCSCNLKKSKTDMCPRKVVSLKNVKRSNCTIKIRKKHPLIFKSSWASKIVKILRFRHPQKK